MERKKKNMLTMQKAKTKSRTENKFKKIKRERRHFLTQAQEWKLKTWRRK